MNDLQKLAGEAADNFYERYINQREWIKGKAITQGEFLAELRKHILYALERAWLDGKEQGHYDGASQEMDIQTKQRPRGEPTSEEISKRAASERLHGRSIRILARQQPRRKDMMIAETMTDLEKLARETADTINKLIDGMLYKLDCGPLAIEAIHSALGQAHDDGYQSGAIDGVLNEREDWDKKLRGEPWTVDKENKELVAPTGERFGVGFASMDSERLAKLINASICAPTDKLFKRNKEIGL